jgi:transcriptional regulator with XRE-family HTH domain
VGTLAKRLAARIRALRGERTLVVFARRLGISKSSLARLETGDQNVSLRTLERLCVRLKCDIDDLFADDRSP